MPDHGSIEGNDDPRPHGPPETVKHLGGGWVAEDAIEIAALTLRVGCDVEHRLHIAVINRDESDSTDAVRVNLLGLLHPAETLDYACPATSSALT